MNDDHLSVLNAVATVVCHGPLAVDFEAVGTSTWDGVSSEDDFHVRTVVAGGQDCSSRSFAIHSDAVHWQLRLLPHWSLVVDDGDHLIVRARIATLVHHRPRACQDP